ncbi:MAG: hypothetical protein ABSA21_00715 [Candidatus Limnocylindrales bacterium]|jgi:hypothetical protein
MGTDIDFIGFSGDCRVEGRVNLDDARLADLLNRRKTITVHDVKLVSTADGHTQEFDNLEISRDELDIVVASGPRGDPQRRLATKPNGVTVKLGPYYAKGFMHAPPTANPTRSLDRKPVMVAITDAVLEYEFCSEPVSQWFRTLLVNRELAISLRMVTSSGGLQPGAA